MSETRTIPKSDVVGFARMRKMDPRIFLEQLQECKEIQVIEDE